MRGAGRRLMLPGIVGRRSVACRNGAKAPEMKPSFTTSSGRSSRSWAEIVAIVFGVIAIVCVTAIVFRQPLRLQLRKLRISTGGHRRNDRRNDDDRA
jgi:hypothetical protein